MTAGADTIVGGSGNDTINAAESGAVGGVLQIFTAGDSIDGGAGSDTVNWVTAAAMNGLPVAATVTNVETFKATSGAAVTLNTTSGFTGLTDLQATAVDQMALTAAATTDINGTVTGNSNGSDNITANGGKDVSLTVSSLCFSRMDIRLEQL